MMNIIHIIDCYYWIWTQSSIDNERCLWLWDSNTNVSYVIKLRVRGLVNDVFQTAGMAKIKGIQFSHTQWSLRLRSLFDKIDWVCHVWCNFWSGYTCRTTVFFGTLKDGLEMNNLGLNNCYVFQNGVNVLWKMVLKYPIFLSKSSKFRVVWTIRFCSNFTST